MQGLQENSLQDSKRLYSRLMTVLHIFHEHQPDAVHTRLDEPAAITARLQRDGVAFAQWPVRQHLAADATQDDILGAYAPEIADLKANGGYVTADVIRMYPTHPDKAMLRAKFLNEHRHAEDEVRFFVEGDAIFYMHIDAEILALHCFAGDLVSVPANTRHWFDMGDAPSFTAIRLFTNPEGWVAQFTGDRIAERFPIYDTLAS